MVFMVLTNIPVYVRESLVRAGNIIQIVFLTLIKGQLRGLDVKNGQKFVDGHISVCHNLMY